MMQIFGVFLAIRFVGIAHGNSLTTTDRQSLRAKMQAISVAVNIILDIALIYFYGPIGAAIATLITEIGITSSTIVLTSRHLRESFNSIAKGLMPIVAAGAGMAGMLVLLKPTVSVIVLVIFGSILYLFLLWVFRFFTPHDRALIGEIVKRRVEKSESH
jgi:O-antigen/teichoic acid export membrane protein